MYIPQSTLFNRSIALFHSPLLLMWQHGSCAILLLLVTASVASAQSGKPYALYLTPPPHVSHRFVVLAHPYFLPHRWHCAFRDRYGVLVTYCEKSVFPDKSRLLPGDLAEGFSVPTLNGTFTFTSPRAGGLNQTAYIFTIFDLQRCVSNSPISCFSDFSDFLQFRCR